MKKIILIASFSLAFCGCNINPNKEARLQKLEAEMQYTTDKISILEAEIQALKNANDQLKTRIIELEK